MFMESTDPHWGTTEGRKAASDRMRAESGAAEADRRLSVPGIAIDPVAHGARMDELRAGIEQLGAGLSEAFRQLGPAVNGLVDEMKKINRRGR